MWHKMPFYKKSSSRSRTQNDIADTKCLTCA